MKQFILPLLLVVSVSSVAHADIAVVVHPSTPDTPISQQQIADIFLGRSSHLPQGEAIHSLDLDEGLVLREVFYQRCTGNSPQQMKDFWSRMIFSGRGTPPVNVGDSQDMKAAIAATPGKIGYLDSHDVDDTVKVLMTFPDTP